MKIEEGKLYVTRDAKFAGPIRRGSSADWCWEGDVDGTTYTWRREGAFSSAGRHNLDIVGVAEDIDEDAAEMEASRKQAAEFTAFDLDDEPPSDIKTKIADEAKRIVSGARRAAYGKPEDNFARIARYWDAYFKNTGRDIEVTAADVSPLMRLMKEARLNETPAHADSFVDLVGYTLTGAEVNGVKLD